MFHYRRGENCFFVYFVPFIQHIRSVNKSIFYSKSLFELRNFNALSKKFNFVLSSDKDAELFRAARLIEWEILSDNVFQKKVNRTHLWDV